MKSCKKDEIRNPVTKRCVKKSGKIGKKLLLDKSPRAVSSKKKSPPKKTCKTNEILNPLTNRCVKRDGKIGKKLLEEMRKRSPSKKPSPIVKTPTPPPKRGVSGPNFISFFPRINGKRILLFGESHTSSGLCSDPSVPEVHTWIRDVVENAPDCVDVVVEQFYDYKCKPLKKIPTLANVISPLFAVREVFCGKTYPRARYHTVDVRHIYKTLNMGSVFMDLRLYPDQSRVIRYVEELFRAYDFKTILRFMMTLDTSEKAKRMFMDYAELLYRKVFGVTKHIEAYMDQYFRIARKELSKVTLPIDRFLDTLYDVFIKYAVTTAQKQSVLNNCIMDVYTLARMFMSFDVSKLQRGPEGCRDASFREMKNIIFYGGSTHARIYDMFLRSYFKATPSIYSDTPKSKCFTGDIVF
jgi:hypothetical protein